MATVTMAELSRSTRQALLDAQNGPVVVVNNGRPTGVILGVEGLDAAEAERVARRVLAERAVAAIQSDSVERGLDAMTLEQVNELIAESRDRTKGRTE
ncbi:MAG: type II toxin-antitoxin system prevent-host-death family antitoxin [Bifidobacteriaceae bacterium]|jgi:prevent-host-death family protein|nr:type II toxin-antitoxin system prevent-host-death family antitoxin [Bifidobacteriaceae bacterium]